VIHKIEVENSIEWSPTKFGMLAQFIARHPHMYHYHFSSGTFDSIANQLKPDFPNFNARDLAYIHMSA
jgi:hypothetical protein